MLGPVARITSQVGRNVMKSTLRNHSHGGVPGENLPFNIHNKNRLTLTFFLFIGSGLSAPFLITLYQIKK